jgi:chromosome partitioning protein
MAADTIAVLSLKGGTGKTTTVRTLADVLRQVGLQVLTIDLDPQGNLSDYFDVPRDASPTIADVLNGDCKAKDAIHDGVIPSSLNLAEVERALSGKLGREVVLKKALREQRRAYDVILIDCPPALGLLTVNGLVAADYALISAEAQYFALQAVNGALELIEQAREYYNDDLAFLGVLMNIADMRTSHSREVYAQLSEAFGEKVFATVIRASIAYAESAEKALSILEYRPDLGADYLKLADEVLARIGRQDARGALAPMLLH